MRLHHIVSLAIFSAPLMFFSIGSLSAYKIVTVFLFLLLFFELFQFRRNSFIGSSSFWPLIVGFMVYSVVVQILFGLLGAVVYGGYASMDTSSPLNRLGTQLFSFALICTLTIYIYRYGRLRPAVVTKPVMIAFKLLLTVSAYELISIYFGLPKVPMYIQGEASEVYQNISNVLGINRISSLAGEPRFFSVILAVVFNSMLFYLAHTYTRLTKLGVVKYVLLLIFILLLILHTQSTSGIIAIGILFLFTLIVSRGVNFTKKVRLLSLFLFILLILSPLIVDVVQTRVVERITEEMLSDNSFADAAYVNIPGAGQVAFDATDATPLALLLDKPFLAIVGVGYGNVSTYVKPYLPYYGGYWGYGYQGVVEPNFAFVKNILNHGIIGNLILIILYFKLLRHNRVFGNKYSNIQLISFYTLTGVFICSYTISSPMLVPIWFFAFHAAILDRGLIRLSPVGLCKKD